LRAKMPEYYIMDLDQGIAETMAAAMPSRTESAASQWMTEDDFDVYSTEFTRTGFLFRLRARGCSSWQRFGRGRTIDRGRFAILGETTAR
jgi:hypothetical protein